MTPPLAGDFLQLGGPDPPLAGAFLLLGGSDPPPSRCGVRKRISPPCALGALPLVARPPRLPFAISAKSGKAARTATLKGNRK